MIKTNKIICESEQSLKNYHTYKFLMIAVASTIKVTFLKIKINLIHFRQSLLFYPSLFTFTAIVLFLITSTIDEKIFSDKTSLDIPFLQNLIFSGSPNAARNILGTIASGWATILGVAYSVTLITLQLSTSKYTSHLIKRFEQDKINQLTLGWFIFVVSYSLLVLKTVRTEELYRLLYTFVSNTTTIDISSLPASQPLESFAPILGVNISIAIAVMGLFIFVLFLKNISNYLRPMILTHQISKQITSIIKSYNDRIIEQETYDNLQRNKISEVRSKTTGIIAFVNWKNLTKDISQELCKKRDKKGKETQTQFKENNKYLIDFKKRLGEKIYQDEILAAIYQYRNNHGSNNKFDISLLIDNGDLYEHVPSSSPPYSLDPLGESKDNTNNKELANGITKGKPHNENQSNNISQKKKNNLAVKILSNTRISKERDLNIDPFYGIDLLRSIAIKASDSKDIDVVNSCISALFDILFYVTINGDKIGKPFVLISKQNNNNNNNNNNKHSSYQFKNNHDIEKRIKDTNENTNILDSNNRQEVREKRIKKANDPKSERKVINSQECFLLINPKETSITDIILSELSIINSTSINNSDIYKFNEIVNGYSTIGIRMAKDGKLEDFNKITKWFVQQFEIMSQHSISYDLRDRFIVKPLEDFRTDLMKTDSLFVHSSFTTFIDPLLEKHYINRDTNSL